MENNNEKPVEEVKQDLAPVTEEVVQEVAQVDAQAEAQAKEQEKQNRVNECVSTVNAAMDRFRCRFDVSMHVTTQGNIPRVVIAPID